RNARASVVELAQRIGLSRSATQERLGRLEREGVIAGYTVRLGSRRSQSRLRAWLIVRHGKQGGCARIIPVLRTLPQVRSAFSVAGDLDLLVEVDAAGTGELDRIRARVEEIPGVREVTTHIVLTTHFEGRGVEEAEGGVSGSVEILQARRERNG
uniref:Lrp/AsnC family transcriptional regulator n=1 Tax=Chelativorans sp. TaxID=2203393 RepID=UPI0028110244